MPRPQDRLQDQLLVLLINLDRSGDRLARMAARLDELGLSWQRLDELGLSWQRLSAVDGSKLDLLAMPEVSVQGYERLHGKTIKAGEVGCYLSHIKAMEAFLASDRPFALIVEDDVDFAEDFAEVLASLLDKAAHWDLVKLSSVHSGTPLAVMPLCKDYRLSVPLTRHAGSGLYLINRHTARRLREGLLPMCLPYDHAFDRSWVLDFRLRLVSPLPGSQITPDSLDSTIEYGDNQARKFPWYRRMGMARYRLLNELQRIFSNFLEWLRARNAHSGSI